MKNKFIDWIIESYERKMYEYEHHEYFTLADMEKAYEFGLKTGLDTKFKMCGE